MTQAEEELPQKRVSPRAQYHEPVLLNEVVAAFSGERRRYLVDGTVGTGGHTMGLLEQSPEIEVLAIDRDPYAVQAARKRLGGYLSRVHLVCGSYAELKKALSEVAWEQADGILLDLGVSTFQLTSPGRGFSFRYAEPLDCRFNPQEGEPAWSLLERLTEGELASILRAYGEERRARKIARRIKQEKPRTAAELGECVCRATEAGARRSRRRIHPAARTVQALRIAVNRELDHLQKFLRQFWRYLSPQGRCAVIAYHSLEDRLVKTYFRAAEKDGLGKVLTKRAVRPGPEEVRRNPCSRSARLRLFERTAHRWGGSHLSAEAEQGER